jgi:endonuclease YncB( thermonuclease family)
VRAIILIALTTLSGPAYAIDICSGGNRAARKVTCLVDGDTGWHAGVKWRLLDIDTPKYGERAECAAERATADLSTRRMQELLRGGYVIEDGGQSDRSGRALVSIKLRDGRDAGRLLVDEGLAVDWPHEPGVWCR